MLSKEQLFNIQLLVMTADEIRGPNGSLTLPIDNEFRHKFYSNTVREMRKYHAREEQIVFDFADSCKEHKESLTKDKNGVSLVGEVVLDNPRPSGDGKDNAKTTKRGALAPKKP